MAERIGDEAGLAGGAILIATLATLATLATRQALEGRVRDLGAASVLQRPIRQAIPDPSGPTSCTRR